MGIDVNTTQEKRDEYMYTFIYRHIDILNSANVDHAIMKKKTREHTASILMVLLVHLPTYA